MLRSINGLAVRQVRTRRLRAILTSFGIVLGVGMVFGVLLLSGTIRNTFDDIVDSAWGTKDLIVMPEGGVLPDRAVAGVEMTPGVSSVAAWVGGTAVRLDDRGRAIKGAEGRVNIAGYDTTRDTPFDFEWVDGRAPRNGLELGVDEAWAKDRGVEAGEWLRFGAGFGSVRVRVIGVFTFTGGLSFGSEGWAVMPEEPVRRLFGMPEGYHQISIETSGRDVEEVQRALQARLGSGVQVDTPAGLGEEMKGSLDALDMVLYFFAGVALFVGGFLILNSFQMTVAQRMRELGMLRTLGAPRSMLRRSVMIEALLLGVIGSVLGLGLGLGMAFGLIELIRGMGIPVGSVHVSATAVIAAVMLGIIATALGAWLPARRAARVSPIAAAQGAGMTRARPSKRRILIGLALYVPGAIFGGQFWFSNGSGGTLSSLLGIGMTMAMFLGMAMAAPAIITPLVRLQGHALRRVSPTGGRLASDATRRNPSRTAATAIALTIGLSVIVVNTAMSASFIDSIHDQINSSFASDVTVRPLGATIQSGRPVAASAIREVSALPDAGVVSPLRQVVAELPGLENTQQPFGLLEGVDPRTIAQVDHPDVEGIAAADIPAALARGEALIGRQYAETRGLEPGDRLRLVGPGGGADVRVAGVWDVYSEMGGDVVRLSSEKLQAVYGPSEPTRVLIRATSDDRRQALAAQVDRLIEQRHPELEAQSAADIKEEIDGQINQQFALFNGIVAIAVLVSLLGVINTLAMSVVERTREIGVLRALGSSRWLVRMTMVQEGLLITAAGAIAGLALGSVIAFAWVNSLGDVMPGMTFHLPLTTILAIALTAVLLGLLAAFVPARRAAKLDVVDALAYE